MKHQDMLRVMKRFGFEFGVNSNSNMGRNNTTYFVRDEKSNMLLIANADSKRGALTRFFAAAVYSFRKETDKEYKGK